MTDRETKTENIKHKNNNQNDMRETDRETKTEIIKQNDRESSERKRRK